MAVFLATLIQAVTSFSNTQLLSKAAQRMIAELRQQVQQHVGRLAVSFYDANRTGVLVSRIMSDVEGVRNLVGTGLVEFVGGMMTAVMAFFFLLHRAPRDDADRVLGDRGLRAGAAVSVQDDPAHLPRARRRSTVR